MAKRFDTLRDQLSPAAQAQAARQADALLKAMPDTPTPGQVCYEAFDAAYPADRFVRLTWHEQAPAVQAAWEAAAQAVLALGHPPREAWQEVLEGLEVQIRKLGHEPDRQADLEALWVVIDCMRRHSHA